MDKFKNSVILMGIDWSKAAKVVASKDIRSANKRLARIIDVLDCEFRKKLR